jgi:hypothetical protein
MVARFLSAAVLALGAASWPTVALAEPPPGSAVSQYVEVIPSATGGTVPTSGNAAAPSAPAAELTPVARKELALQPAPQRKVLRDVATSPSYGAPQGKLPKRGATQREAVPAGVLPSPKAVAESGAELPILLAVVLGTAVAACAWAFARARRY